MFRLTCEVSIKGPNEENVRLKIRRNSGFWINDCYYHNYRWDDFGTYLDISCYIYDGDLSDLNQVCKRAAAEVERSNKFVNFLFGIRLINDYPYFNRENIESITSIQETPIRSSENINRIHSFMGTINSIVKSDNLKLRKEEISLRNKYLAAIAYFNRSVDALEMDLDEDAILNIYRGLEILGRERYKGIEQRIINDFRINFANFLKGSVEEEYSERHKSLFEEFKPLITKRLMTDTRKIMMALRELKKFKVEELSDAKRICDVRNSLSHGNTELNEISIEVLSIGMFILRKMIVLMLLNRDYYKAYPFAEIKYH